MQGTVLLGQELRCRNWDSSYQEMHKLTYKRSLWLRTPNSIRAGLKGRQNNGRPSKRALNERGAHGRQGTLEIKRTILLKAFASTSEISLRRAISTCSIQPTARRQRWWRCCCIAAKVRLKATSDGGRCYYALKSLCGAATCILLTASGTT
jgi:hypothetical protein